MHYISLHLGGNSCQPWLSKQELFKTEALFLSHQNSGLGGGGERVVSVLRIIEKFLKRVWKDVMVFQKKLSGTKELLHFFCVKCGFDVDLIRKYDSV